MKDRRRPGTALCLSGGGYRVMLFHIGALWRLYELRADRHELANATQRCAFAPLRVAPDMTANSFDRCLSPSI
jgi:hypothetical protein